MINRTAIPLQNPIEKIKFSKAETVELTPGALCHSVLQDDCKVVEFEIEFDAGYKFQDKALIASTVNDLLLDGSTNYSAYEIASFFDNEGAFVDTSCTADKASIVMHCLERSIPRLLPFLLEVIRSVSFPEKEVKSYLALKKQKLSVNLQKVAWVAKNEFLEQLVGSEHPYSWKVKLEDYDEITREDLLSFYEENYKSSTYEIYIAGKVTPSVMKVIEEVFGQEKASNTSQNMSYNTKAIENHEFHVIEQKGAIQSAIRLGIETIDRKHQDFPALFIANTILGGYFGSRLMSNIREDKGYTYGIGSGVVHLNNLSYFIISTEVGAELTQDALNEIESEMNILQNQIVSPKELGLVKNYILGNIMKGFDGSFSAMSRFKMLNHQGLDYSYYENLVQEINQIKPERIQEVAKRYLNYAALKKIIVGKL